MADTPDNGRRRRTIEIDAADAPMLAGAMRLAAGTALMYGAEQENARARFQRYRQLFLALSPPEAFYFRDEEAWAEIAVAMDGAPDFEVTWERNPWPEKERGRATVRVGTKTWRTGHDPITESQAEALAVALDELAPLGCARVRPEAASPDVNLA